MQAGVYCLRPAVPVSDNGVYQLRPRPLCVRVLVTSVFRYAGAVVGR